MLFIYLMPLIDVVGRAAGFKVDLAHSLLHDVVALDWSVMGIWSHRVPLGIKQVETSLYAQILFHATERYQHSFNQILLALSMQKTSTVGSNLVFGASI